MGPLGRGASTCSAASGCRTGGNDKGREAGERGQREVHEQSRRGALLAMAAAAGQIGRAAAAGEGQLHTFWAPASHDQTDASPAAANAPWTARGRRPSEHPRAQSRRLRRGLQPPGQLPPRPPSWCRPRCWPPGAAAAPPPVANSRGEGRWSQVAQAGKGARLKMQATPVPALHAWWPQRHRGGYAPIVTPPKRSQMRSSPRPASSTHKNAALATAAARRPGGPVSKQTNTEGAQQTTALSSPHHGGGAVHAGRWRRVGEGRGVEGDHALVARGRHLLLSLQLLHLRHE